MKLLLALLFTTTLFADPTIICDSAIEVNLNNSHTYCQFEQLWPGSAITIEAGEATYIQVESRSRSNSTIAADYGMVHILFLPPGDYRFGFEGHGLDTVSVICADYQVPVELERFWFDGAYLRWTVNETGYPVYEVHCDNLLIARIPGTGQRDYRCRDRQAQPGEREYYLACVENGRREVLDSVTVFYGNEAWLPQPSMECYQTGQITLTLPQSMEVKLTIYNILGQEIAVLADSYFQSGTYGFRFDSSPASGLYLIQFKFDNQVQIRKIVLQK